MPKLTVRLTGCRNDKGTCFAAIHSDPDAFPDDHEKAVANGQAPIEGETATVLFDLEPGRYAVVGFHDENSDGELNMRFKIIPREGIFISHLENLKGMPSFDKHAFDLSEDMEITCTAKYFL
jgi:uncharacterized protein (DUF2141 family)